MGTEIKLTDNERAILNVLTEGRQTDTYLRNRLAFSKEAFVEAVTSLRNKELVTVDGTMVFTAYTINEAGVYALASATNAAAAPAESAKTASDVDTFTVGDKVRTTVLLRSPFLGELPIGTIGTVDKPYDIREDYLIVEFMTSKGVTGWIPLPDVDKDALELVESTGTEDVVVHSHWSCPNCMRTLRKNDNTFYCSHCLETWDQRGLDYANYAMKQDETIERLERELADCRARIAAALAVEEKQTDHIKNDYATWSLLEGFNAARDEFRKRLLSGDSDN